MYTSSNVLLPTYPEAVFHHFKVLGQNFVCIRLYIHLFKHFEFVAFSKQPLYGLRESFFQFIDRAQ